MAYTWRFRTAGAIVNPLGRDCYKGPMIDVEVVMSKPYTFMPQFEEVRARLLPVIVNTTELPEATRETTLRTMNSLLAPIFARLLPDKQSLQVLICSKRRCTEIEDDLSAVNDQYVKASLLFPRLGVLKEQVDLIYQALVSESPIVRVAGKSAVVLLAAYMEMDLQNG